MRASARETYRRYAFPDSGDEYFDAKDFHPEEWAELAKAAGIEWMCLTAPIIDGFCLFDSPHPMPLRAGKRLGATCSGNMPRLAARRV